MISVSNAYQCMRLGRFFCIGASLRLQAQNEKNLQPMRQKEEKL